MNLIESHQTCRCDCFYNHRFRLNGDRHVLCAVTRLWQRPRVEGDRLKDQKAQVVSVSELRTIAFTATIAGGREYYPALTLEIFASAFDEKPSTLVTTNSAGPLAMSLGTTNTTSSGDA